MCFRTQHSVKRVITHVTTTLVCATLMACNSGSNNRDGGSGTPPGGGTPPPAITPPDAGVMGDGRLREILEFIVTDTGIPAVTALFVHEGIVLEKASFGKRSTGVDGDVSDDDLWHLGSLTKSITSTLAAVLVEQGQISWDTTLEEVFPELVGDMRAAYLQVSLEQLLSHTAGIMTSSSDLATTISEQGGELTQQRYRFTRETLRRSPANERGIYAYSNAGYIVAGAMLERVANQDWEALTTQYVFQPLNMSTAGFGPPGTAGGNDQPTGHYLEGGQWQSLPVDDENADNPAIFGPAGTVHASAADITGYLTAHLAGARGESTDGFLSKGSFSKLHTPAPDTEYSLGWNITDGIIGHIGSNDRWLAQIAIIPEQNFAVFIATNAADGEAEDGGEPLRALNEVGTFFVERFEAYMEGSN